MAGVWSWSKFTYLNINYNNNLFIYIKYNYYLLISLHFFCVFFLNFFTWIRIYSPAGNQNLKPILKSVYALFITGTGVSLTS